MEKEKRQQLIIKICCVIASFCLWIYISNINNPIRTIVIKNVKVNMMNVDTLTNSKFILLPEQEFKVNLTIKGLAVDIYNIKPEQFNVVADLGAYAMKKGENKVLVEIKNSPENVTVLKNEGMWINVQVDQLKQKTVPIKAEVTGNRKNNFAELNIEEATVSGAAKYIDEVEFVRTISDMKDFNKDLEMVAPLEAVDKKGNKIKNVNIKPQYAKVKMYMKKIKKTKYVKVNVKTTGAVKNNIKVTFTTSAAKIINISGDEETINKINSIDTETIDLSKITDSKQINVKLKIPKGITAETSNVNVNVNVDVKKKISKVLNIPIKILNLSEGYSVKLDTEKVAATISGYEENVKVITEKDIKCTLDLKGLKEGEHSVDVKVEEIKGISINIDVSKVKATITKDNVNQQEENDGNKNK